METSARVLFLVTTLLLTFQVHQSNAIYLSYVAFFYSAKLMQFTGYAIPTLYSIDYFNFQTSIPLVEKRVTTGSITPFESNYDFCPSLNYSHSPFLNLIEILSFGERDNLYKLRPPNNATCKHACTKTYTGGNRQDKEKLDALKQAMCWNYQRHWMADAIPVMRCPKFDNTILPCTSGFPIGLSVDYPNCQFEDRNSYFIYNHLDFIVIYEGKPPSFHPYSGEHIRGGSVVSIKVIPRSLNHSESSDCSSEQPFFINGSDLAVGETLDIKYTYSVQFIRNDSMKWTSRWEYIFDSMTLLDLHWTTLIYSTLIVLFTVLVPVTVIKAVFRDSILYKRMECGEDIEQNFRWRLVTNEFIPPAISIWLSLLLGSVIQLIFMAIAALMFFGISFYLPESRSDQMIWVTFVFLVQSSIGGYSSSSLYRSFSGEQWKSQAFLTALISPWIAVSVFTVLNVILLFQDSSAYIPFYTLGGFIGVLYLCSLPFNVVGSLLGFKEEVLQLIHSIKKWLSKPNKLF